MNTAAEKYVEVFSKDRHSHRNHVPDVPEQEQLVLPSKDFAWVAGNCSAAGFEPIGTLTQRIS